MAILFNQADGSDQHYDTYEEFEQALVLLKRLNGEKVPQDLLDEVKAKHGGKEPKPFQVQIDGSKFESAIREATRELAEELDRLSKDRTPISDEVEDSPTEYRTGDIVKITETFEDSYGDVLHVGDLHRFGKLSSGRVCISAVFVDGDNLDKLQLVCRKEDRKDIGL